MSLLTQQLNIALHKYGFTRKGVLTSEEAFERSIITHTVITKHNRKNNTFFFTDDHVFGYGILPEEYGSSTGVLPMTIVPREELPSGIINTIEEYKMIFLKNAKQINSLEELINSIETQDRDLEQEYLDKHFRTE